MQCAALPIAPPARVTSGWGWRNRPSGPDLHTGIDLGAPEGTPVFSMLPGVVQVSAPSGQLSGYGQVVVLQHGPKLYSLSAHLSRRLVAVGDQVKAGTPIGAVGRTAGTPANPAAVFSTSGPHLHLEFLDAWPPAGRDLNRLHVGQVLKTYGVIVPERGPLQRACSTLPAPSSPGVRPTLPPMPPTFSPSPLVAQGSNSRAAQGVGVAALLALAAFLGSK